MKDPFLQIDDYGYDLRPLEYETDFDEVGPYLRQPHYEVHQNYRALINGYGYYLGDEHEHDLVCSPVDYETSEIELFNCQDDEHLGDVDITIKGTLKDDDDIFLRLRIADKEGNSHNSFLSYFET